VRRLLVGAAATRAQGVGTVGNLGPTRRPEAQLDVPQNRGFPVTFPDRLVRLCSIGQTSIVVGMDESDRP
jgi:hypothetical protein